MLKKTEVAGKATAERQSNIELLRILTMLLIVADHYVVSSGLTSTGGPIYADPLSWRSLFLLVFGAWGKTGINCFVLITSYFMCRSQITFKKFAKLLFEMMFYRLIINVIFWVSGYTQFSFVGLVKILIPIWNISANFTSVFLVFYLLIPFLSILVQHMNERQHIMLIVWCGFTYVFLGTVPGFSVTMNYVAWFCVLFIIASYIRLYPKKVFQVANPWAFSSIIFISLSILSIIACAWYGARIKVNMAYRFIKGSNTFLSIALGLSIFMFFKNLKIGYFKTINKIAASTYGVLLIHANSDTMRQWLWKDTLDVVGHYSSKYMPLYAIGSVLAIFIICSIIDQLRIKLIEKPFFRLWDKHWDGFVVKCKKIESKVFLKLGAQE